MVQIIGPGRQKMTTGQKLAGGLEKGLSMLAPLEQQSRENQFLQQLTGMDFTGVSPEIKRTYLSKIYSGETADDPQIISRALRGEATLEELQKLKPKTQIDIAKTTKEPKKTQSSKPIDPEQLSIIKDIRTKPEFNKATPSQKYQMLTDAGVSRENAESESKIAAEEFKVSKEEQERKEKQAYDYHKESKNYDEELRKRGASAKREYATIKDLEKSIGKISPTNFSNLLKGFGTIGEKLSNAFLKKDAAAIASAIPEFLEGKKEIFGMRLSDADLKVLQDKLPDISKSEEANRSILKMMKKYAEQAILKERIGREIKQKNKNLRPLAYEDLVEERLEEMIEPVTMITSDGKRAQVPAYKVSGAINAGWTMPK